MSNIRGLQRKRLIICRPLIDRQAHGHVAVDGFSDPHHAAGVDYHPIHGSGRKRQ